MVETINVASLNCFRSLVSVFSRKPHMLLCVLQDWITNASSVGLQSKPASPTHIDVPCFSNGKVWCDLITGRSFNFISPPNWILSYLKALSRRMTLHSSPHPPETLDILAGDNPICFQRAFFWESIDLHMEKPKGACRMQKAYASVPIQASDNRKRGKFTLRDLLVLPFVSFKDGHNMQTS